MSVESEACSGRPSTSHNKEVIEKVCQIPMEDRHLTLKKIVEEVGISRDQFTPINKKCCLEILGRLCDTMQRRWPDMWTGKKWQLHHDNAPAHCAHVVKGFLAKDNAALVQQPPYSPDLAPCNLC